MRDPHKPAEYGGGGVYTEIEPPSRLAFTWIWDDDRDQVEQLIVIDFEEDGRRDEGPVHAREPLERGRRCATTRTAGTRSSTTSSGSSLPAEVVSTETTEIGGNVERFLKGAAAGGVGAAVVMTAAVALAGSGVGGIFNLGQTNTVSATSTLSGSTAGAQLQVGNTSTNAAATALKLDVTTNSKAPIVTNGTGRVTNLNADRVDSWEANQLARGSMPTTPRTSSRSSASPRRWRRASPCRRREPDRSS